MSVILLEMADFSNSRWYATQGAGQEHKEEFVKGFTSDYHIRKLIWYEVHEDVAAAITREKQIKKWNRAWKIAMIGKMNPGWRDLFEEIA